MSLSASWTETSRQTLSKAGAGSRRSPGIGVFQAKSVQTAGVGCPGRRPGGRLTDTSGSGVHFALRKASSNRAPGGGPGRPSLRGLRLLAPAVRVGGHDERVEVEPLLGKTFAKERLVRLYAFAGFGVLRLHDRHDDSLFDPKRDHQLAQMLRAAAGCAPRPVRPSRPALIARTTCEGTGMGAPGADAGDETWEEPAVV